MASFIGILLDGVGGMTGIGGRFIGMPRDLPCKLMNPISGSLLSHVGVAQGTNGQGFRNLPEGRPKHFELLLQNTSHRPQLINPCQTPKIGDPTQGISKSQLNIC